MPAAAASTTIETSSFVVTVVERQAWDIPDIGVDIVIPSFPWVTRLGGSSVEVVGDRDRVEVVDRQRPRVHGLAVDPDVELVRVRGRGDLGQRRAVRVPDRGRAAAADLAGRAVRADRRRARVAVDVVADVLV